MNVDCRTLSGRKRYLEEIDTMIFVKLHDRLLPIGSLPIAESIPTSLSFASLRSHFGNLDVEQFLDGSLHIVLGCVTMNLERILIVSRRTMDTLFGDERTQQNLMRLELDAAFGFHWGLYPCHLLLLRLSCLLR